VLALAAVLMVRALTRRSRLLAVLAAPTVVIGATDWITSSLASADAPSGPLTAPLSVVSHNLLFRGNSLSESLAGLRDAGADVIALQEVTAGDAERLHEALAATHPHIVTAAHDGPHGFAIFSSLPIDDVTIVRVGSAQPIAQCVTVSTLAGPVPLCNVHLSAPTKALRNFAFPPDLDALQTNAERRTLEWSLVARELDRRGASRAIALGDFNSTEAEPLYRAIRREWVDAFRELHLTYGGTWRRHLTDPPLARIDYVFTRGAIRAERAEVIRRSGSDHLPVAARLLL
jgi:endonuclease/exonuclease/phosphatase (EEP) superfamily protein YafD